MVTQAQPLQWKKLSIGSHTAASTTRVIGYVSVPAHVCAHTGSHTPFDPRGALSNADRCSQKFKHSHKENSEIPETGESLYQTNSKNKTGAEE